MFAFFLFGSSAVIDFWYGVCRHSWRRYCLPMDCLKTCLRSPPRAWPLNFCLIWMRNCTCMCIVLLIYREIINFWLVIQEEDPHNKCLSTSIPYICLFTVYALHLWSSIFPCTNYVNGYWVCFYVLLWYLRQSYSALDEFFIYLFPLRRIGVLLF